MGPATAISVIAGGGGERKGRRNYKTQDDEEAWDWSAWASPIRLYRITIPNWQGAIATAPNFQGDSHWPGSCKWAWASDIPRESRYHSKIHLAGNDVISVTCRDINFSKPM